MKKALHVFLLVAAAAVSVTASGQHAADKGLLIKSEDSFLEPLQKRDSALIGDQFRYGFHLKGVAEGTRFALPDFSEGFMDSVEVVSPFKADTIMVHGRKNEARSYDIDMSMVITSFDEGNYTLLPLSVVRVAGTGRMDTLVFEPRTLDIRTMPVDTAAYKIHDIKGQIRYPLKFSELLPYMGGALLLAVLVLLTCKFVKSRRGKREDAAHNDPPYLVALRKLEHYRSNKYWTPEKQKAYYSGITDALREYIDARYGIDAMEMTTAEIFKDLKSSGIPADIYEEMKTLFETADFVKFAKASASDEENARALPAAVRFVTVTYQSQLAEEESAGKAVQVKPGGKMEGGEA